MATPQKPKLLVNKVFQVTDPTRAGYPSHLQLPLRRRAPILGLALPWPIATGGLRWGFSGYSASFTPLGIEKNSFLLLRVLRGGTGKGKNNNIHQVPFAFLRTGVETSIGPPWQHTALEQHIYNVLLQYFGWDYEPMSRLHAAVVNGILNQTNHPTPSQSKTCVLTLALTIPKVQTNTINSECFTFQRWFFYFWKQISIFVYCHLV